MWSPSDALLAEYLAGECTDDDARQIERWVAQDPANRARVDELRAIYQAPWPPSAPDIDAMWAGVRRTMRTDRARSAEFGRAFRTERRRWWRAPVAVAATVLLAVGAALTIDRIATNPPAAPATEPMREYATPRGQRATLQLSDGTNLVLAADSRLRVPASYGHGVREVYLEGEALFEVTHDSTRPFRVHAKDAVTQVLGTRFDVRAYPEDSAVAVAVAEGAVALGRAEPLEAGELAQGVVLRRGELGTLASDGRVTTATGAMVASYLAWAEGRLHFVETPLPEVVRTLGRWYDLDVRLGAPALAARTLTAEFAAQSAEELLAALAIALDARVVRSGKTVTLHPKS